jgi:hypothetical protein
MALYFGLHERLFEFFKRTDAAADVFAGGTMTITLICCCGLVLSIAPIC